MASATVTQRESQALIRPCLSMVEETKGFSLLCDHQAKTGSPPREGVGSAQTQPGGCFGERIVQYPLSLCKPGCTSSNLTPATAKGVSKDKPKRKLRHRSHFSDEQLKGSQGFKRKPHQFMEEEVTAAVSELGRDQGRTPWSLVVCEEEHLGKEHGTR